MSLKSEKRRAQVKSRFYYIFWAVATVSVFTGQLYVGSGYREMSRSFHRVLDERIDVLILDMERPKFLPVVD